MGLDMYAYSFPAGDAEHKEVDLDVPEDREDLHYWRKHHDLHGWMQQLYFKKGGEDQDFNCNTVRLNTDDLDALESAVRTNTLPHTEGFFFGNYPPDDESIADDLEFIRKARAAIAQGDVVVYDSWW